MWKDTTAAEPPQTTAPPATAKPVTQNELHAILDRLEAARDIFRENRELREVLSRELDPGIAEPQRGVGRDDAEIRPDAVERGNHHRAGSKE
jgi:hypothetical protein